MSKKIETAIKMFCEPRSITPENLDYRSFKRYIESRTDSQLDQVINALFSYPVNQYDGISAIMWLKENI